MYIIYILLISLISIIKKKINIKSEKSDDYIYINKTKLHNISILKEFIKKVCIAIISIDILYFIIVLLYNKEINIIKLILNALLIIVLILNYTSLEHKCSKINKQYDYNRLNFNEKKHPIIIIYNLIISLILIKRVGEISIINLSLIINLLIFILTLIDLSFIITFLYKNKNIICFSTDNNNDLIKPINFYKKIEIGKLYNYVIYIIIYILIIYCKIPYMYVLHITIAIISFLIINKKIKKINKEQDLLYKNVTILNNKPGAIYAFEFEKDIEFTKNMVIITVLYILSVIIFYSLGTTAFLSITIQSYILIVYELLKSKKNLIKLVYSLDENYINKEIYDVKQTSPVTIIENINFNFINLKQTFYRVIYIDNNKNVFESNIILYDPELYLKNINIYINSKNINDYIIITEELY